MDIFNKNKNKNYFFRTYIFVYSWLWIFELLHFCQCTLEKFIVWFHWKTRITIHFFTAFVNEILRINSPFGYYKFISQNGRNFSPWDSHNPDRTKYLYVKVVQEQESRRVWRKKREFLEHEASVKWTKKRPVFFSIIVHISSWL